MSEEDASSSTSTTFEFTFSEELLVATHQRYRDTLPAKRAFAALKIVLGVFLALVLGVCAFLPPSIFALIFVGWLVTLLVLLVFARDLNEWIVRVRFRGSPHCDDLVRVTLSPDGLSFVAAKTGRAEVAWATVTRARRFGDGFLISRSTFTHWLPVSTLTRGSAADADALLRRNVADYRAAPG